LVALNSDKPIEEMFSDFMDNKTDPECLDLLNLSHNNENIFLILFINYGISLIRATSQIELSPFSKIIIL
jgi:hypothetical protein